MMFWWSANAFLSLNRVFGQRTAGALSTRGEVTVWWCATAAAMVLVTVTTVVGNLVVMAALWRVRRAPSHYPLTSLVAADLLVGLTVLPIATGRELFVFHLGMRCN